MDDGNVDRREWKEDIQMDKGHQNRIQLRQGIFCFKEMESDEQKVQRFKD